MQYLISIPQEGNTDLILALLKELNVSVQPKAKQQDWWDELPESVKKSHEQGVKDAEEGRVIDYDSFIAKYRK